MPGAPQADEAERQHRHEHGERVEPGRRDRDDDAAPRTRRATASAPSPARTRAGRQRLATAMSSPRARPHDRESERVDPDRQRAQEQRNADAERDGIERVDEDVEDTDDATSTTHAHDICDDPFALHGLPRSSMLPFQPRRSSASTPRRDSISPSTTRSYRGLVATACAAGGPRHPSCDATAHHRANDRSRVAAASTSRWAQRCPVLPSATASCDPPLWPATAGTPHAAASRNTMPNPSASSPPHRSRQHIVNTSARVQRRELGVWARDRGTGHHRRARRSSRLRSLTRTADCELHAVRAPHTRRSRRRTLARHQPRRARARADRSGIQAPTDSCALLRVRRRPA